MTNYFFLRRATLLFAFTCLGLSNAFAQSIITTYAGSDARQAIVSGTQAVMQNIGEPFGIASDNSGGFYFTNAEGVYRVASNGPLTVIAGDGAVGFSGDGGPATSARLSYPRGVAVDGTGNLFIADFGNHRIRKITSAGIISTVAGDGIPGFSGDGGPATSARLSYPYGVAVDGTGNLFIAANNRIRKVTATGTISTVAGDGTPGFSGDGGPATFARLSDPRAVAADRNGNLFIADTNNNRIRMVTPDGTITTLAQVRFSQGVAVDTAGNVVVAEGVIHQITRVAPSRIKTTVAGNGTSGFNGDGGLAVTATLFNPLGVAVDAGGNIFIADTSNLRIRKVGPNGVISTVAGSGLSFVGDGGLATVASLNFPTGVAVDGSGNVLIGDTYNRRVRRVRPDGKIETVAGSGEHGYSGDGGPASSATFRYPTGVAADSSGNLFIVDTCNDTVRRVSSDGVINTLGSAGTWFFCDFETYFMPAILAVDQQGTLFVPNTGNHRIQRITSSGTVSTAATFAQFEYPTSVAVDHEGNLFVVVDQDHRIRKVTPNGIMSTVAGTGDEGFSGDGGAATSARLMYPTAVAVDREGNLFIADSGNARIRKVGRDGIITTVAGNGISGFSGDGGLATAASLGYVYGLAVDAEGNLFLADSSNNRIRKVTFTVAPALTALTPDKTSPTAVVEVVMKGVNFTMPLTINTGSDITVDNVRVADDNTTVTATFTIASNATLGPRPITITTASGTSNAATLTIVPPFPDLQITSTHTEPLAVGFNGVYRVDLRNVGLLPAPGPITLTDRLPAGLTYVSGTGNGWSCSAVQQTVTCGNSEALEAGASSSLTVTVAVRNAAMPGETHEISVAAAGDLVASNNVVVDVTRVIVPSPNLQFTPSSPRAGQQATMGITLPEPFPYDVTGAVTLTFVPDAAIPFDDPAIQFETGGRQVTFVIPANTLEARFGSNAHSGPLVFQTGTVAGNFSFAGMLEAGTVRIPFSATRRISRLPPEIQAIRTSTTDGFAVSLTLLSTPREISQLVLRFDTTPRVRLSCGSIANSICTVSGSTLTFNVKGDFDSWYASDATFGSLATLRFPLSIEGTVQGTVRVTLRNSMGESRPVTFTLP
jgi:uncharacterized repeat protein (TIGR01451 family)